MTLQELLILLGVIYALECLVWVPAGTLAFWAPVPKAGWRAVQAWRPNPRWKRAVVIGTPWPPLTPPLIPASIPTAVDRALQQPAPATASKKKRKKKAYRRAQVAGRYGWRVGLRGQTIATVPTEAAATALCGVMNQAAATAEASEREALVAEWLAQRYDPAAVRERLGAFRYAARWLNLATHVLLLCLLVGLPIVLFADVGFLQWVVLVLGVVSWAGALVGYGRVRRELFADHAAPTWGERLMLWASPLLVIRARDQLAREVVGAFAPVAVAAVVLPPERLEAVGRAELMRLRWAEDAGSPWLRDRLNAHTERLLSDAGVNVPALLAAPARDGDSLAWCPSCKAQYRRTDGACNDCAGVPLRPF